MQKNTKKIFLTFSILMLMPFAHADMDVNDNTNINGNTSANGNTIVNGNLTVNGNISSSGCIAATCSNIGAAANAPWYGYIVNNVQTNALADGDAVPFNLNVVTNGVATDDTGTITVDNAGIYQVNWQVTTSATGSGNAAFQLFAGTDFGSAVALPNTTCAVYINSNDTLTFSGQAVVTLADPSQQLFLVNVSNQPVNLISINTGSTVAGAESAMSASISINKIAPTV